MPKRPRRVGRKKQYDQNLTRPSTAFAIYLDTSLLAR